MFRALKRKEIIQLWNDPEHEKYHDFFCCPACRDILTYNKVTKSLQCLNIYCLNKATYNLKGVKK